MLHSPQAGQRRSHTSRKCKEYSQIAMCVVFIVCWQALQILDAVETRIPDGLVYLELLKRGVTEHKVRSKPSLFLALSDIHCASKLNI